MLSVCNQPRHHNSPEREREREREREKPVSTRIRGRTRGALPTVESRFSSAASSRTMLPTTTTHYQARKQDRDREEKENARRVDREKERETCKELLQIFATVAGPQDGSNNVSRIFGRRGHVVKRSCERRRHGRRKHFRKRHKYRKNPRLHPQKQISKFRLSTNSRTFVYPKSNDHEFLIIPVTRFHERLSSNPCSPRTYRPENPAEKEKRSEIKKLLFKLEILFFRD